MIGGVPVGMQMPGQGGMLALPSAQVGTSKNGVASEDFRVGREVSATSPVIRIDEILKAGQHVLECLDTFCKSTLCGTWRGCVRTSGNVGARRECRCSC